MYKGQMGIGYLPRRHQYFCKLTVKIIFGRWNDKAFQTGKKDKLESLLRNSIFTMYVKATAMCLSGGERRKNEIARALADDPKFILLDELFAGIDPITVEDIR
jgi:lipopolysaccharide export system ATP-binding protein